jgi:hypothetical protein
MFFISGFDLYRRSQRNVKDILHSYLLATHYDPNWYKAWHTWALANFEVVNHLLNQAETKAADVMGTTLVPHIVPAVQGNVSLRVRIALINLASKVSSVRSPYAARIPYRIPSDC